MAYFREGEIVGVVYERILAGTAWGIEPEDWCFHPPLAAPAPSTLAFASGSEHDAQAGLDRPHVAATRPLRPPFSTAQASDCAPEKPPGAPLARDLYLASDIDAVVTSSTAY